MATGIKPLNPIGGIPKQDRPKGHYVYLHRRGSVDGDIFYVGKGSGRRGWGLYDRVNPYWLAVARKHGVYVDILKAGLTKDQALSLEVDTIKAIGLDKLTNVSIGGESGRAGIIAWNRVKIKCSNGMTFNSGYDAAQWVKLNGFPKASGTSIYACCKGRYMSAYGFTWAYDGSELPDFLSKSERLNKKVYCSNGMVFDSQKDAAAWVSDNISENAHSSNINAALKGRQKFAFGLSWAYEKEELVDYVERKTVEKSIKCSNGMIFKSISEAARWLRSNGIETARPGGIVESLKGRQNKSYGLYWEYKT